MWEANMSRLTTKLRWVVETNHREIKVWRFFAHAQRTIYIRHEHNLVRLLCAACNCFKRRAVAAEKKARQEAVLELMLAHKDDKSNEVWDEVQKGKFSRLGKKWTERDAALDEKDEYDVLDLGGDEAGAGPAFLERFPRLTLQQLEDEITLGVYQVKLAKFYTREHRLGEVGGGYKVEVHPERASGFLRVRIQSQHVSKTRHYVWIKWEPNNRKSLRWCCTCPPGLRTVGCCAHVASVIWYLAVARHAPAKYLARPTMVTWENLMDARENEGEEADSEEEKEEVEQE